MSQLKSIRTQEFPPSCRRVSSKPSTDCTPLEKAIGFTQSADSNVNPIQKHHYRRIQNVWQSVWAFHGPVKLTDKIKQLYLQKQKEPNPDGFIGEF